MKEPSLARAHRAFSEFYAEMHRGRALHPVWPEDPVHQAAIVAEEAGELVRAALHHRYEDGTLADIRTEAIQTGAMALRVLLELDELA